MLTSKEKDDESDDRSPLFDLVSLETDVGEIHRGHRVVSQVPPGRNDTLM